LFQIASHDGRVFYDHRQKWPKVVARPIGVADGKLLRGRGRIFSDQNLLSRTGFETQLVTLSVHRCIHIGVFHRLRSSALDNDG